jgi:hypothetical protein
VQGRRAYIFGDDPVESISFGMEYLSLRPYAQYLENGNDELLCFFQIVVIRNYDFRSCQYVHSSNDGHQDWLYFLSSHHADMACGQIYAPIFYGPAWYD